MYVPRSLQRSDSFDVQERPSYPTETLRTPTRSPYGVHTDDYKIDLCSSLTAAWKLLKENEKTQVAQKNYNDQSAKCVNVKHDDRVMVYMPAACQGKTRNLACPFHGPYCEMLVTDTNMEVHLVNHPENIIHSDRMQNLTLGKVTMCG